MKNMDRSYTLNELFIIAREIEDPEIRLPGSGGAADFISYSKKTMLTIRSGEFVEKRDYLKSPGFRSGGNSKDESGLFTEGSGLSIQALEFIRNFASAESLGKAVMTEFTINNFFSSLSQ